MIKDLVVNLTLEAARDPAAEFALSIAAAFEAHIAATAFAFDPVVTPAVLDGLSSTWVDVQREESRAAAKAAIARFEAAAERDGLSFEHRLFETSLGDAISPVRQDRPPLRPLGRQAAGARPAERRRPHRRSRPVPVRPARGHRPLYPEGAAQARPGHGRLGRQPARRPRHRRRDAVPRRGRRRSTS